MQSRNKRTSAAEREHMARIAAMPCALCKLPPVSEVHHIRQDSGFLCVPLCPDCHRGAENGWHGRKAMWRVKKWDELSALAQTVEWLMEAT